MDCISMEQTKVTYPLLPYSQVVYDSLKTHPDAHARVLHIRLDGQQWDIARLRIAMEKTHRSFGVFEMAIDGEGHQYRVARENILEGPYHSVVITEHGPEILLDIRLNRILGDETSKILLLQTFIQCYEGAEPEADGYWEWLKAYEDRKQTARYVEHRKILEEKFGVVDYPVNLTADKSCIIEKEGLLQFDLQEFEQDIEMFKQDWLLSLNGLMVLATGLAIMDMEGTERAGLTWAYDGRETEQEQRIFGSLHRDVPIVLEREPLEQMIRQTRNRIREGIRLSDYPYTLTQPEDSVWHKAVNVIFEPSWENVVNYFSPSMIELSVDPETEHVHLDVEVFESPLRMQLRYDTACYTEQRIAEFAQQIKENVRKILDFYGK